MITTCADFIWYIYVYLYIVTMFTLHVCAVIISHSIQTITGINHALKLKGAINIEPMDSADMKLKRNHAEIQLTDVEDDKDDEPLSFASPVKSNDHERYSDTSDNELSDH